MEHLQRADPPEGVFGHSTPQTTSMLKQTTQLHSVAPLCGKKGALWKRGGKKEKGKEEKGRQYP